MSAEDLIRLLHYPLSLLRQLMSVLLKQLRCSFTAYRSAYSVIQRRPNVRFTVPAFFKNATLAGQSITAPPLPGDVDANANASVAQQNALSLVFMILNSKATQKGELHFNVLLEHVDVRWATYGAA